MSEQPNYNPLTNREFSPLDGVFSAANSIKLFPAVVRLEALRVAQQIDSQVSEGEF